jgi:hypothetical protein
MPTKSYVKLKCISPPNNNGTKILPENSEAKIEDILSPNNTWSERLPVGSDFKLEVPIGVFKLKLNVRAFEEAMKYPQCFLISLLHLANQIKDPRMGKNTKYKIEDYVRAVFCLLYYQVPSLNELMYIKRNANKEICFFDKDKIPCDRQIANIMDKIPDSCFLPLFNFTTGFFFSEPKIWEEYLTPEGYLVIAIDGTTATTSHNISCPTCCQRHHKDLTIDYHHDVLQAAVISQISRINGKSLPAFPLHPEFAYRIDGNSKNETERIINSRWFENNHEFLTKFCSKIIYIADDIYSCQPICKLLQDGGAKFIFTCKPGSHNYLYDMVNHSKPAYNYSVTKKVKKTSIKERITFNFYEKMPLKMPDNYLNPKKENTVVDVNFVEVTIDTLNKNGTPKLKDNKPVSRTISFATNIDADLNTPNESILRMIEIGRSRWDIEDLFNTMKNRNYHLSHVYSHGKQGNALRSFILLNILAYSVHLITDILKNRKDPKYRCAIGEFFNLLKSIVGHDYYVEMAEEEGLMDGYT